MRKRLLLLGLLLALGLCSLGSLPAQAQDVIPIAEARQAGVDAIVTVEGTVTRAFGDFVRFQDASGPTGASALVVRQTSGAFYEDIQDGAIQPGAELQVTGTLSEFNGLLQINEGNLDSYSVGEQQAVPDPQEITLSDLQTGGEAYESELVRIEGLRFAEASGAFSADQSYAVTDGAAALVLRVQGPDETTIIGEPIPPGAFTYTGVTGQFFGDNQLIPIRPTDVQAGPSVGFAGRYDIVLEADDDVTITVRASDFEDGQTASVTASVGSGDATPGGDVTGVPLPATFTLSAADPAYTLTLDPVDDMEEEGVERLEIVLASEDVIVTLERFTLWILDDPTATTTLYPDLEGQALRDQLFENFGSPPTLGYDVARDTLYGVVYNEGGIVEGYYTGYEGTLGDGDPSDELLEDGINTEHTWPQSLGAEEEPARSNMHILVPARDDVNSARSNYPYGEIPDEDTDRWFFEDETLATIPDANPGAWSEVDDSPADRSARRFEPRHRVKGDIARKLFYFRTIYPERAALSFFDAQRATLLDWNAGDAPSAEEVRRNVLIASYQGNLLNPFVLDPSLAGRAYEGQDDDDEPPVPPVVEVDVTRTFGDPDDAQSYLLVALPGDVSRPLAQTLNGQAGEAWQAYWDNGQDNNFFVEYDGSERFRFQPGRGFWLISTQPWTVEDEFDTLPLEGGAVEIPLHEGWNIISNPLDQDVSWASVEAANGGALQPLWAFAGSYSQASTFASAKTGEAFYFLNDQDLETLTLPYPAGGEAVRPALASAPARTLTLAAYREGRQASAVRVRFTPEAAAGLDVHDWFAPPARFAALSLRLDAPPTAQAPRRRALAQEARPALGNGQRFALTLRAAPGRAVTLRARELAAFTGEQVVLHAPATDRTYDLRAGAVTLHPTEETTRLRLLIGSEAFVDQEGLPQTVQLQVTGATPFRSYTTLRYTLPDARRVRVVVYDVLGRRVRTLVDRRQRAGRYDLRLHRSAGGPPLASGLYFIRLRAGDTQRTEKVIVVK